MNNKLAISVVILFLALLLVGIPVDQSDAASAKDNYRTYCAQCHGLQGNGLGVNIRDMSVQPRNHTDSVYMSSRSDHDLFKADQKGGLAIDKSVLMPPWGDSLSTDEINAMVQYLRLLCHCRYGGQ
jgi:mono/diheme cytochrome c family protein